MPDTDDPKPRSAEPTHHISEPTPVEEDEFHEHADRYLDQVAAKVEELQDGREDVDFEFSVRTSPLPLHLFQNPSLR